MTLLSSAVTLAWPFIFGHIIDIITAVIGDSEKDISGYPIFIQSFLIYLDRFIGEASQDNIGPVIRKLVWLLVIIGLARTVSYFYPGFRGMINAKLGMDIREHYFGVILKKGHRFFQKFRTGDLVTRLTDDIDQWPKIAWFSCSGIFRAVESFSKFLFCIGFMLAMNWELALLSITPLPVMLVIFYILRSALSKRSTELQQIISKTNDALEAAFSGVRILKAFRGETNQTNKFREVLDERIGVELNLIKLWMGLQTMYGGIQFVGQVIVMVVGGMMVIRDTLSYGEFYAFYVYLSLLLQPLLDIPQLFVSSRQAFACIDREIEIDETPGGTENAYTGSEPLRSIQTTEVRDVSFRYDEDLPLALENVNLTLKRGERAAVVGAVGCGKSTLIRLVAGLLPPDSGEVLINGKPLSRLSVKEYNARIGYIPQESTLFSESVAENVRFGRDIQERGVRESLDMAQVLEEMENLPEGINEVLGQKGLTISGGQKQRLAIARAVAGEPDVLLMDDCTSSLDAENERDFWRRFAERFPEAACLIVTHRLATARQADVIYVLDEGRIVGKGTHKELLESCEEYQNFLTREELQAALATRE